MKEQVWLIIPALTLKMKGLKKKFNYVVINIDDY